MCIDCREIWTATGRHSFVSKNSVKVALPLTQGIVIHAANDDAIFDAIRARAHLEHRIVERLEDGHRWVSRVRIHDGSVVQVEGEERRLSPRVTVSRLLFPAWVVVTLKTYRSARLGTRVTAKVWFKGNTGVQPAHSAADELRRVLERLRDFYNTAARHRSPRAPTTKYIARA